MNKLVVNIVTDTYSNHEIKMMYACKHPGIGQKYFCLVKIQEYMYKTLERAYLDA